MSEPGHYCREKGERAEAIINNLATKTLEVQLATTQTESSRFLESVLHHALLSSDQIRQEGER